MGKSLSVAAVCVVSLLWAGSAHAQFDSLSKGLSLLGGSSDSQKSGSGGGLLGGGSHGQATGDLKTDLQTFKKFLNAGTVNMARAAAKMHAAMGEADKAELLSAQATQLEKDGLSAKQEDYKKIYKLIDESPVDRKKLAKVPRAKGQKYLVHSAIYLGVGALADRKALALGKSLAHRKPNITDVLNGSIIDALGLAQLVVLTLPDQILNSADWGNDLAGYFSSHKISPPSQKQLRKQASSDLPAEQVADLFATK